MIVKMIQDLGKIMEAKMHWEDPEGSGGEGGGRGDRDVNPCIHVNPWLIHVNV